MAKNPLVPLGNNLGEYLKEQRESARLSVRQLSELAGVSNPYLSQIERGVKRPSAEILQQIAKGLSISAETLYVQAGLLDPRESTDAGGATRSAIRADPALTSRQRQTLLDIYDSFVVAGTRGEPTADGDHAVAEAPPTPAARTTTKKKKPAASRTTSGTKKSPASRTTSGTKKSPAKKTAATSRRTTSTTRTQRRSTT